MADNGIINDCAARQHGCVSLGQARRAGLDRAAVARRVDSGDWLRLCPGVYALASAPPVWERQMAAAVLSRPHAVVAGTSAAYLHGFAGFGPARPVIVVPWSGNARSPIARVIRSSFFSTLGKVRVRGFEATNPAETVLTLAGSLSRSRLEAVLDDCLLTGRVKVADFDVIYDRNLGARVAGCAGLRVLLDERAGVDLGIDSTYLERLLERALSDPRIPGWVREHPMIINGKQGRFDVFIEDWLLVVEADSRRWHARQAHFESDRARDNALAAMGIRVVRLTYRMLKEDMAGCVETVLAAGTLRRAPRDA